MDQAEIPAASADLATFSTSPCVKLISLAWQILRLVSAAERMVGTTPRTTGAMKPRRTLDANNTTSPQWRNTATLQRRSGCSWQLARYHNLSSYSYRRHFSSDRLKTYSTFNIDTRLHILVDLTVISGSPASDSRLSAWFRLGMTTAKCFCGQMRLPSAN